MIVLRGERAAVVKLCFLPSTRLLAAGDENGTVVGWDLDARQPVFTWPTGGGYTFALAAGPDGRRVYTSGDGVRTYDRKTGTAETVPHAFAFALNPAGTRLLTQIVLPGEKRDRLLCKKLSKTGKAVPAWTGRFARDWSGVPGAPSFHLPVFFPDGKRFAVFEEARRPKAIAMGADLLIGDAATGKERIRVPADEMDVLGPLLVHPDGKQVVAVIRSKLVVWDAATGERLAEPANPDGKRHFTGAAFHPSGRRLLTSSDDTVRAWDTATWRPAEAFAWDVGKVKSVAYSPDGLLAAAGGDKGKIAVWDTDE